MGRFESGSSDLLGQATGVAPDQADNGGEHDPQAQDQKQDRNPHMALILRVLARHVNAGQAERDHQQHEYDHDIAGRFRIVPGPDHFAKQRILAAAQDVPAVYGL